MSRIVAIPLSGVVAHGDRHDLDAVDRPVARQVGLEQGSGVWVGLEAKTWAAGEQVAAIMEYQPENEPPSSTQRLD